MSHIQEIELPDGTVVLARLSTPDGYGSDDHDVGVLRAAARLEHLGELVRSVGAGVLDAARAARPDEAAVTFGVELTAKSGRALAVLAAGEATTSVQVTLTWRAADRGPDAAAARAPESPEDRTQTTEPGDPLDPAHRRSHPHSHPHPRSRSHPVPLPAQSPTQEAPEPSTGSPGNPPTGNPGNPPTGTSGAPGSPGTDA